MCLRCVINTGSTHAVIVLKGAGGVAEVMVHLVYTHTHTHYPISFQHTPTGKWTPSLDLTFTMFIMFLMAPKLYIEIFK